MPKGKGKAKTEATPAQKRMKALSFPLRAEILLILSEEVSSASKIGKKLGESTGTVSYHIRQLRDFGCAEKVEEKKVRGAMETFYRATERHLVDTEEWEQLPEEIKDHLRGRWGQSIIDDVVLGMTSGTIGEDKNFHLTQIRQVLDEQGFQEALDATEEHRLKVQEIAERSADRLTAGEGLHVSSFQGCFRVPASNA